MAGHGGLTSMSTDIHAYGGHAHAWAYDCVGAHVFGVGFIQYIDSYAHVQRAKRP